MTWWTVVLRFRDRHCVAVSLECPHIIIIIIMTTKKWCAKRACEMERNQTPQNVMDGAVPLPTPHLTLDPHSPTPTIEKTKQRKTTSTLVGLTDSGLSTHVTRKSQRPWSGVWLVRQTRDTSEPLRRDGVICGLGVVTLLSGKNLTTALPRTSPAQQ